MLKHLPGKLPLLEEPERYVPSRIMAIGARSLAIEHPHALAVSTLPPLHRDPFDRLLVAQATLLDLTIATADPAVAQYPISTLLVSLAAAHPPAAPPAGMRSRRRRHRPISKLRGVRAADRAIRRPRA